MSEIAVRIQGATHRVASGTTLAQLASQTAKKPLEVLAAVLDNHVVGLSTPIMAEAQLEWLDANDARALDVLHRTIATMLQACAKKRYPTLTLHVGQALLRGYYFEVTGPNAASLDLEQVAATLTADLMALAEADVAFERSSLPLEAAVHQLTDPEGSKAALLATWASPTAALVRLGEFTDLAHGPSAPSTRHGKGARVMAYPPGLVLLFPAAARDVRPDQARQLWRTYSETRDWNRKVGVSTIGDLNRATLEGRVGDVQKIAEALHEKKIVAIADAIATHPEPVRIICIAGPSSAGKTTFVRRLSVQLRVNGIEPVILGLDDYYKNRVDCPRDADGNFDFEALEALELELIHEHFQGLLAGHEVKPPRFDFVAGVRADDAHPPVRLAANQVLLVEGIHGLNPALTTGCPRAALFRIYINALTQLSIDTHNRSSTTDQRLLRRIVRDRRYRGTPAAETIQRWPSVRRGEELHIFPHEDQADATFNSALMYETAVLKTFAWRYLLEVPRSHPSRVHAYRLLKLLDLYVPVFPDEVPATSVLREFIGGSGFAY